jgi:branched-chain amino acid transport system permease protein
MIQLSLFLYGLITAGIYSLIALGFSLSSGTLHILNIAHGDFVMIGAYITYWLFTLYNVNPLLSIIFSFSASLIIAFFVDKLVINPLELKCKNIEEFHSVSVLVFFALSMLLQNMVFLLWGANYVGYTYLDTPILILGVPIAAIRLIIAIVAYLCAITLHLFLFETYTGTSIRAFSQNKERALLIGINVNRLRFIILGISVALAGIAGSLISALYAIFPAIGGSYLIRAMCIAALGGLGSMKGAIFGSIILGFSESFVTFYIGSGLQDLLAYSVLVLILLVKPSGLFAR